MSLLDLIGLLRPSAWWLILMPILFLPPIYLLRRWQLGGWLALTVCLGGAYLAMILPQGESLRLLGRPIRFDALAAYVITLLFITTACLFLLSLHVPQGWSFYPFGLAILTLFTAAVLNRHLGIIALIVELMVLLSVFIIQAGRIGSVRAGLRFLVMMTLAVPLFLLAARQLDFYQENRNNLAFLSQTALLFGGGFGIWLAVAPLHGWLTGIAAEAKPAISAFMFILFPSMATVVLLHLLETSPWLIELPQAARAILLAGLFTAAVGGLFAAVQRAFGPLMGYATLFDLGASLIALSLGSDRGLTIVLYSLLVRTLALLLVAISAALIDRVAGGDSFQQARGLAYRLPLPTLGLLIGGLTLAGVPLTAGFVARWLLVQALADLDPRWPLVIFLGSLGVTIGYLRGLHILIDAGSPSMVPFKARTQELLVSALILLCLALGLFPQLVLETVSGFGI